MLGVAEDCVREAIWPAKAGGGRGGGWGGASTAGWLAVRRAWWDEDPRQEAPWCPRMSDSYMA